MKTKTSATLFLALTFLLGGVAGAVSQYLYSSRASAARRPPRPPGPQEIVDQMAQDLKLDAGQKEQVKSIISESREKYHRLSQQFRPNYDAIRQETRQQIRAILREDQRSRFEEIVKEMDARFRERSRRGDREPK
jgi:Spy/CpxP family protein refolding chaperone